MNPLSLRATNFRTYEHVELDLPTGCAAIVGPNGSGKSSLLMILELALFGARSFAEYLTANAPSGQLEIEVTFEHAGELYRVRRGFNARGRGKTTCDLEQQQDGEWVPLTGESQAATSTAICELLGFTRETFCASSLVMQGDSAAFTRAAPRDRKRILGEVLGLDRWDRLLGRAKTDHAVFERQLEQLAGATDEARRTVADKQAAEDDHRRLLAAVQAETPLVEAAEAALDELQQQYVLAREASARLATCEAQLQTARAACAALVARSEQAADAQREAELARQTLDGLADPGAVATLEAECELLRDLFHAYETAAAEYARARRERAAVAARITDLRASATRVLETVGEQTCDRCGQTLGAEAAERAAASYLDEARALEDAVPDLPAEPVEPDRAAAAAAENALARARADQQQRARLEERIRQCEATIAAAPPGEEIIEAAAAVESRERELAELEPVDLAVIEAAGVRARSVLAELREQLERLHRDLAACDTRLDWIRKAEQKLADNAAAERDLQARADVARGLERAYGRDGIPALILESSAVPMIETRAQEILSRLGGKTASAVVELHTQAANKTNDQLRETLEIVMTTSDGATRAYENWSGGERTRLDLALRLALADLLAHRRGAESSVFVIDEPAGLDDEGKQALLEILRDVHARGIARVYLVSHETELRDAFEQVIEVQTDGERSWLSTGVPAGDPVAA